MILFSFGVRSLPRWPIFLAEYRRYTNFKIKIGIWFKTPAPKFINYFTSSTGKLYQCEEYSFGQKMVAILGTLIWPNTVVSNVTVRRCWYRNNFHKPVARNNIRIREANVRGRLAWAQGKRYWTVEMDWSRVIFSDECKIIVGENNRVFAWRKPGEEWLLQCHSQGCKIKMSLMI